LHKFNQEFMKMKKMSVFFALVLAFALTAMAQTAPPNDQSSSTPSASQDSSSPAGSQNSANPSTSQSPSSGQQGSSSMGQTPAAGSETKTAEHGHKVKGCIRSEGGKFVLEDAHGRMYSLNTSEDLSAHVGHEVVVHGAVSGSGSAGSSMNKSDTSKSDTSSMSSPAGATAGGNKEITVTKVDMVSETCKLGGKHSKTSSNDQPKGTTPDKQQ
jgi:uncharacterized protein DUF5818